MKLFLRLLTITTLISATELLYSAEKKERSEATTSFSTKAKIIGPNKMLFCGVAKNSIDLVKKALSQGADINFRYSNGYTCLMYASEKGFLDIVKLLIENNANPNIQNLDGYTALMLASKEEHVDVEEVLLYTNTELNYPTIFKLLSRDNLFRKAWLRPVFNEIIQKLQTNKIDINNVRDLHGFTILMYLLNEARHSFSWVSYINKTKKTDELAIINEEIMRTKFDIIQTPNGPDSIILRDSLKNLNNWLIALDSSVWEYNYKTILEAIKLLLPYVKDFYAMNNFDETVFDYAEFPELADILNQGLETRKVSMRQHMNEHLIPQLQNIVFEYSV